MVCRALPLMRCPEFAKTDLVSYIEPSKDSSTHCMSLLLLHMNHIVQNDFLVIHSVLYYAINFYFIRGFAKKQEKIFDPYLGRATLALKSGSESLCEKRNRFIRGHPLAPAPTNLYQLLAHWVNDPKHSHSSIICTKSPLAFLAVSHYNVFKR